MLRKDSVADCKKCFLLALFVILILQCAFLFLYGLQKPNLFIDEWWSYNLANGRPSIITGITEEWLGKPILQPFWNEIITVKAQDMFDFHWVWENQIRDVHPPLYYLLLHILCGFWNGEFSLIPGLIINLAFFVGTQYLLWHLSLHLFSRDYRIAFLMIALYGCSLGGMSAALSIRMYMMLTFFVTWMIYLNIRIIQVTGRRKYLIGLACVHVCGFLTQYYYIIYAFFAALPVLYKLANEGKSERYRSLITYCLLSFLSLFICWLIFPAFLAHIFGNSTMGKEAFANLTHSDFFYRIIVFLWILLKNSGILFLSLASFFIFIASTRLESCRLGSLHNLCTYITDRMDVFFPFSIILFATVFPFATIAKVAPVFGDRYLMPLLPSIVIILCGLIGLAFNVFHDHKIRLWGTIFVLLGFVAETVFNFHIHWYWNNHAVISDIVQKKPNTTFIAVIKDVRHPLIASQGNTLRLVNRAYIVTEDNLAPLQSVPDKFKESVLLWTQEYYPTSCPNLFKRVEKVMNLKNPGMILYDDFGKVRFYLSSR